MRLLIDVIIFANLLAVSYGLWTIKKELERLRNRIINEQDIRHKQVTELQLLNKKCWQQLSGISYKLSGKQKEK